MFYYKSCQSRPVLQTITWSPAPVESEPRLSVSSCILTLARPGGSCIIKSFWKIINMPVENTFIYLFAFAGTGKLTIAREIQKKIPAILVDNHLINNVIFSLIDTDGVTPLKPRVWELVDQVRGASLDAIKELAKPGRNFIFTNELLADTEDWKLFEDIKLLAEHRKANFAPVRLLISSEELCRRIVSDDRKVRLKSISTEEARLKSLKEEVFKPDCNYYELDVSELTAEEAATRIIRNL